jgi:hypothetical protein
MEEVRDESGVTIWAISYEIVDEILKTAMDTPDSISPIRNNEIMAKLIRKANDRVFIFPPKDKPINDLINQNG